MMIRDSGLLFCATLYTLAAFHVPKLHCRFFSRPANAYSRETVQSNQCVPVRSCDGRHTSFMCESDERHIGGWVGTGGARLAYCDWLL